MLWFILGGIAVIVIVGVVIRNVVFKKDEFNWEMDVKGKRNDFWFKNLH